ncbi:MAG: hypothetical protein N3A58_06015 [Spirochaetes bacterium]|nr:hypothetical protein [Spirochaetota bacterium]
MLDKFKIIEIENIELKENIEISILLSKYLKKNNLSYFNINDIVDKKFILNLNSSFYGPFSWNDNFTFKKRISCDVYSLIKSEKGLYYLNLLEKPKNTIKISIFHDKERFYSIYNESFLGQSLKIYPFPLEKINFILCKKIDLNQNIIKKDPIDYKNINFVEEEVNNIFYKLTGIDLDNIENSHLIIKLDLYSSLVPWEILIKKCVKNKNTISFVFIQYDLSNRIKLNFDNLSNTFNKNISYFYFKPETKNSEKEREIAFKGNYDRIILVDSEELLINNFRNDFITFISAHGYLKENFNTIILNEKPISLEVVESLKSSPFFILFLSCLITISSKDNIIRKLINKGLKESIFSSFLIEDNLSYNFFYEFSKELNIINDPLINYMFILENKYKDGYELFKFLSFYDENKVTNILNREKIFN